MAVGVPGTGIGGLFYVLLAAMMPVREFWLTLRGRSSLKRWKIVMTQWMICATIVAALWGEAWLLKRGFAYLRASGEPGQMAHRTGPTYMPPIAISSGMTIRSMSMNDDAIRADASTTYAPSAGTVDSGTVPGAAR